MLAVLGSRPPHRGGLPPARGPKAAATLAATAALSAAAFMLGLGGPVAASEIYDPSVSTCTGPDCSSVLLNGTVTNSAGNSHPWVTEAYARAGECLRLATKSQAADLEMTVVAPNGDVFRNDDSGGAGCVLCSLVKLVGRNTGWYTVQLSHEAGIATHADFQLAYGRYSGANPNCAPPTPPSVAAAAAAGKPAGGASPTAGLGDRTDRR